MYNITQYMYKRDHTLSYAHALRYIHLFLSLLKGDQFHAYLCITQFQQCPSPPPGQPRGICSSCQSRGWGIRNFIAAQGLGICVPRGDSRAFDTRVLESAMDEFIGKDEAFVEQWLVRQGLEKLADVFKGMFSQL